ncbi:YheC/YheD family protein [Paenibacillus ginsengarvi]|uniref:YheC/YheD family protein n=1 Tax=Paenibacillus ginsengarvi TaxID=400777 RepID=A0A3B0CIN0_9BACL|nr:YheC/YheD family protein [Paenibacillus ginsengarvi]RKN85525.1 YheC/YheD family protein [Paenibacillus ginsengarvi]
MELSSALSIHRPLLGILTMDDSEELFRGNRSNFIDIIKTGTEMGVSVCVVTVKDLKPGHKKIIGYMYNPSSKSWSQQIIGIPRVLYNRIPQREDESDPEVQRTLQAVLKMPQVRIFNPTFFNKWSLFEWLGKAKTTAKYIPATRRLSASHELEGLLKLHGSAYLKPISGKAGKGIMKVDRCVGKVDRKLEYALSIQETKGSAVIRYPKISQLWSRVKDEIGHEEYIAQQSISIVRYKKRPFDLRLLVQKNYKGEWDVTGIGARLAGKMSITTHVPRGGSIDDPEKLLAAAFGLEGTKRILLRARKAALAIARQVEKKSGHMLGEMSMDMGVDIHGGIWFFEANSKPMKFDEPQIRKKSLERIVQYSLYLIRTSQAKTGGHSVNHPSS